MSKSLSAIIFTGMVGKDGACKGSAKEPPIELAEKLKTNKRPAKKRLT